MSYPDNTPDHFPYYGLEGVSRDGRQIKYVAAVEGMVETGVLDNLVLLKLRGFAPNTVYQVLEPFGVITTIRTDAGGRAVEEEIGANPLAGPVHTTAIRSGTVFISGPDLGMGIELPVFADCPPVFESAGESLAEQPPAEQPPAEQPPSEPVLIASARAFRNGVITAPIASSNSPTFFVVKARSVWQIVEKWANAGSP